MPASSWPRSPDIMGVSGRKMLAALVAGTTDPDVLAEMAKTRLRARLPELRKALSPWLRTALVEAALGATRKNGYLQAKYRRVRSRRGHQRAVIAVAHAQLEIIHTLLSRGELYSDLGADFFERQQAEQITRRAIRQLERLGHQVILKEAAPATT